MTPLARPTTTPGLWLEGAEHFSFAGQAGLQQRMGVLGARHDDAVRGQVRHPALIERIGSDWWRATWLGDAEATVRLKAPAALSGGDRWRQG